MPENEKRRQPVGVVLEQRRYIGFTRTPVQDAETKPIVSGLPTRQDPDASGRRGPVR